MGEQVELGEGEVWLGGGHGVIGLRCVYRYWLMSWGRPICRYAGRTSAGLAPYIVPNQSATGDECDKDTASLASLGQGSGGASECLVLKVYC